jgi:hypothetical protein
VLDFFYHLAFYLNTPAVFPPAGIIQSYEIFSVGFTGLAWTYVRESLHPIYPAMQKKEKRTVFPDEAMKTSRGIRTTAAPIINLGTRWRLMVDFTPRPFHPRVRTPVPIE